MYDRLNIPDLIHFSGADFTQVFWYRLLLQFDLVLVQTDTPPNMQQIPLLPYMVAVESGDYDKHLYEFQLCCRIISKVKPILIVNSYYLVLGTSKHDCYICTQSYWHCIGKVLLSILHLHPIGKKGIALNMNIYLHFYILPSLFMLFLACHPYIFMFFYMYIMFNSQVWGSLRLTSIKHYLLP